MDDWAVAAAIVITVVGVAALTRWFLLKPRRSLGSAEDRATYAMFDYLNPPDPKAPSKAIHWFKMAYNKLYWVSARGLL